METEWLTANEAAQYLKVKTRTLLQWVRESKILRTGYPACGAVFGDFASVSWMLSCVRHPLALLREQ